MWTLGLVNFVKQKPLGTDIKNVWEIARFQFLSTLAHAYIITGDEKYALFAIDKVNSWIDDNPFPFGPHWTVAMEPSIRLMNWCLFLPLLEIFKRSASNFQNKLTQSLLEHLIYISENLELSPSQANNHYLTNLVALLLGPLIFPSLSWTLEISEFAEKERSKEMQRQFKPSGINFEGSLPYHRLSSEICLMGAAIIRKSGRNVSSEMIERLRQAASFTKFYTQISDECPVIGDNDSGVFVRLFSGQESNEHQYLNSLFDHILEDKNTQNRIQEFLCVHFGLQNFPHKVHYDSSNTVAKDQLLIRDFDGLIIAHYEEEALFFNTLNSCKGHTHNDKLSIYPVIGRKMLFVDRGSFSYTGFPEKRHQDRMTSSHNGPLINGWEQNRIWTHDPFYVNGDAECGNQIDSSAAVVTITGWHVGYGRFRKGLKTFRRIRWDTIERTILITDWIEGSSSNETFQFNWYFLINPVWISILRDKFLILTNNKETVYFEDVDEIGFNLGQGFYCPSYQDQSPCQTLTASCKSKIGKRIRFLLHY
jgi:hypothetical protein